MNFTVITPVLNGGPLLRGCIESVRRERCYGETVEHIIVDGGSTDGSVALARSQGAHVIERPDLGLYERLNLGFAEAADGLVIALIGADDLLVEGCVPRVLAAYRAIADTAGWQAPHVGSTRTAGISQYCVRSFSGVTRSSAAVVTAAIGHPLIHISATLAHREELLLTASRLASILTFAALSRVQKYPIVHRYFLAESRLAITIPTTIVCAVLADDIIIVVNRASGA